MQDQNTAFSRIGQQLRLFPIHFAPERVRLHGLQAAHSRPLVGASKGRPSWRTTPAKAWSWPLVQIDPAHARAILVLDVDGPEAVRRFRELLAAELVPEPNWSVERWASGNVQATWCLLNPVATHRNARLNPMRVYRRVVAWLHDAVGADRGFTQTLQRNPMERVHRQAAALDGGCETTWGRPEPYRLSELRAFVPSGYRVRRGACAVADAIGRNVEVFGALMRWSGQPRHWDLGGIEVEAARLNALAGEHHGGAPLDERELAGIVKSVTKIQEGNRASGQTQLGFARIQAARGCRGGRKSKRGPDPDSARSRRPWEAEGVSRATHYRLGGPTSGNISAPGQAARGAPGGRKSKRGPDPDSARSRRPWEAEGVSRATHYRRPPVRPDNK